MQTTYAVTWREATGRQYSGRLEVLPQYLRLEGGNRSSGGARHLSYADIACVRMARHARERIDDRQTLVIEQRRGETIRLAAVAQMGALAELAERIAGLVV